MKIFVFVFLTLSMHCLTQAREVNNQTLNDSLFSEQFPVVIDQWLEIENHFDSLWIKSFDNLCTYCPSAVSYAEYEKYQTFLKSISKASKKNKKRNIAYFIYATSEFNYHFMNALKKNAIGIYLETTVPLKNKFGLKPGVRIDLEATYNFARSSVDVILTQLLTDSSIQTRYRGLIALNRILIDHSSILTKKLAKSGETSDIPSTQTDIPLDLDSILESLTKLETLENNTINIELIETIKAYITL